jgi:ATP synthase protein I
MAEPPRQRPTGPDGRPLGEEVNRKAARKRRAREAGNRSAWFGLGMFGLVGWSVAVPALLGVALGLWLDERWPAGRVSWTLTFLIIGVALGCLNAWYWVKQESGRD